MKKTYVLDTSALLSDYRSIFSYGKNDIVIPLIVLEEIDNHKKRMDGVGLNARRIIKVLDKLREKSSLYNGAKIRKDLGMVKIVQADFSLLPKELDPSIPDHQIIATAIFQKHKTPNEKVVLVSCDINMRIKGDSVDLLTEDYKSDHAVETSSGLYTGLANITVKDEVIDLFYDGAEVLITENIQKLNKVKLYSNQFLMLVSDVNEKKTALARYTSPGVPLRKIAELKDLFGISAKNKEQAMAIDLLMDPNIPVVTLTGLAGGGKTLLTCAAGLQQIMKKDPKDKNLHPGYSRLIVSRPVFPMGKDIGYLPGTLQEKLEPWLVPIQDNLRFLFGNDKLTLTEYIDRGLIEIEALSYIRGRSIQNAFICIDESQNLNSHEVKTILTRVGSGSKIVLTGDVKQIDAVHLDEMSNGLTHVVEKLKNHSIAGHIMLAKGERSEVATICSEVL